MTVREFITAPTYLRDKRDEVWQRLLAVEARLTKTTTQLTGMPHGGGSDRHALLAKASDLHDAYEMLGTLMSRVRMVLWLYIGEVPFLTERERSVLEQRYHSGKPWKAVLEYLHEDEPELSERQMYRSHLDAIRKCEEFGIPEQFHPEIIAEYLLEGDFYDEKRDP